MTLHAPAAENSGADLSRFFSYVGSLLAIVGPCSLAGTRLLWIVAMVWTVLMLITIAMEEREMGPRFGESYMEYCRRVPRFLPF